MDEIKNEKRIDLPKEAAAKMRTLISFTREAENNVALAVEMVAAAMGITGEIFLDPATMQLVLKSSTEVINTEAVTK